MVRDAMYPNKSSHYSLHFSSFFAKLTLSVLFLFH